MQVQLIRGTAAQQELKVTGDAFAAVKKKYIDAWMASDVRDTAGREKLWVATTILTLVENQLRQFVSDGKIADEQLKKIRKAGEKPTVRDRVRGALSI